MLGWWFVYPDRVKSEPAIPMVLTAPQCFSAFGQGGCEMGQFVHVMCRTELSLGKQRLEVSDYTNSRANDGTFICENTLSPVLCTRIYTFKYVARKSGCNPGSPFVQPLPRPYRKLRGSPGLMLTQLSWRFPLHPPSHSAPSSPLPHYCFFNLMKRDRAGKRHRWVGGVYDFPSPPFASVPLQRRS